MKRHEVIGIKQTVRLEWLEKSSDLLLSGLKYDEIRQELALYLSNRMGNGTIGDRSEEACKFSVNMLMNIWITPEKNLIDFRNDGANLLRILPKEEKIVVHWGMICTAYPFWYNVARQIGILLKLQETFSAQQIAQRMIEQYGDRPTVSRNVRFVIRSIFYWNMLTEKQKSGEYSIGRVRQISSPTLFSWLIEANLHSISEDKASLSVLQKSPALFAFEYPYINGDKLERLNNRIEITKNGFIDELVTLKNF